MKTSASRPPSSAMTTKIVATKMTTTKAALITLTGLALLGSPACDALSSPGRFVLSAKTDQAGHAVLFFTDGVATLDPTLNVAKTVKYPIVPASSGVWETGLSADGLHGAYSWMDWGDMPAVPGEVPGTRPTPSVVVFGVADGALEGRLEVSAESFSLSDDGGTLVVAPGDRNGDRHPPTEIFAVRVADGVKLWTATGKFSLVENIPGANAVAALTELDPTTPGATAELRIVELSSGATRATIPLPGLVPYLPGSLATAADGSVVAVASAVELPSSDAAGVETETHYTIVNVIDGSVVAQFASPPHLTPFPDLAVSAGGHVVAGIGNPIWSDGKLVTNWYDGKPQLLIWQDGVLTGQQPVELWGKNGPASPMALSADATRLVVPEFEAVRLRSVPDGAVLAEGRYVKDIF